MSAHPPISLDDRVLRVGAWVRLKDVAGRPKVPIVRLDAHGLWVDLNGEHVKVSADQLELLPAMRKG
jgi:hypothetical protein